MLKLFKEWIKDYNHVAPHYLIGCEKSSGIQEMDGLSCLVEMGIRTLVEMGIRTLVEMGIRTQKE